MAEEFPITCLFHHSIDGITGAALVCHRLDLTLTETQLFTHSMGDTTTIDAASVIDRDVVVINLDLPMETALWLLAVSRSLTFISNRQMQPTFAQELRQFAAMIHTTQPQVIVGHHRSMLSLISEWAEQEIPDIIVDTLVAALGGNTDSSDIIELVNRLQCLG